MGASLCTWQRSSDFEIISDIKGGASVIQVSWSRPVSWFRFYEGKTRCLGGVDVVIRSIGTLPWGDEQAANFRVKCELPHIGERRNV
jgi:hypothetical protein